MKITVTTTHSFLSQDISDIFCGIIEGNDMTCAWCGGVYPLSDTESLPDKNLVWYGQKQFFMNPDWKIKVEYDDPNEDEEGDCTSVKEIGEAEFRLGLQTMANHHGTHFNDLVADGGTSADAVTYDVLFQCVVLGDIVYG